MVYNFSESFITFNNTTNDRDPSGHLVYFFSRRKGIVLRSRANRQLSRLFDGNAGGQFMFRQYRILYDLDRAHEQVRSARAKAKICASIFPILEQGARQEERGLLPSVASAQRKRLRVGVNPSL